MASFKIEIVKVDSVYFSARLISGSCSKRLSKCSLYCFLYDHIPFFSRYAFKPRYYTFIDLCQYLHIVSKNHKLSFDVVVVDKHVNTPF